MPRVADRKLLLKEINDCIKFILFSLVVEEEMESDLDDGLDESDAASGHDVMASILPKFEPPGMEFSLDSMLSLSNESDLDALEEQVSVLHHFIATHLYVNERSRVPKSEEFKYMYFLHLPPDKFRMITRVNREAFDFLVGLISPNPVFHSDNFCQQAPVHWQLACALDRMGNDGQGVSVAKGTVFWGLGQGTVLLYYLRVVQALWDLRRVYIRWPDKETRTEMSARSKESGFPGAVGILDGIHFPLHEKPTFHGDNFFDRKKRYSVKAQVVNNDLYEILYFSMGMAGSMHDSRMFSRSQLTLDPQSWLDDGEYILADSAYTATEYVVPTYKKRKKDKHSPAERALITRFNDHLAKTRVKVENTFGILKGRWSSLRGLRIKLRKKRDIYKVQRHTTACAVLHNIVLNRDTWSDVWNSSDEEDDGGTEDGPQPVNDNHLRHARTLGKRKQEAVRTHCFKIMEDGIC